jgi:hypothetical protein
MATLYATNTYVGDGSTTDFNVTFPYLDPSHVLLDVAGNSTGFSFINPGRIRISGIAAPGQAITISRQTPVDEASATFVNGSTLLDTDLNGIDTQLLYAVQEAKDKAFLSFAAAGETSSALSTEISARIAADTTEAISRASADEDNARQVYVVVSREAADRVASLALEFSARADADASLQAQINQIMDLLKATPTSQVTSMTDASTITYTDTAVAGSLSRTVSSKLNDIVSAADTDIRSALSSSRRVWVPAGTYAITSNLTVTADLIFDQGAVLTLSSGVTLQVNGQIDAPRRRIFSGAGKVVFGAGTDELFPEWWGAFTNGSDATPGMTLACQAACDSGVQFGFQKTVRLGGMYTLMSRVSFGGGDINIKGLGEGTSGIIVAGQDGFYYTGTQPNVTNRASNFFIEDFAVVAKGNNGVGVNRGIGIFAAWPVFAEGHQTFLARNINCRSDTYNSDEATAGYFGVCIQARQCNVSHIENYTGNMQSNNTSVHLLFDNSVQQAAYELHIHKPAISGGFAGIQATGEWEEVLIEPLGIDNCQKCIIMDASGVSNGGSGNDGVLTIRGGDLNAVLQAISIVGWRWIYIDGLDIGLFSTTTQSSSNNDVVYVYGSNIYSGHVHMTNCYIEANFQTDGNALVRFTDMGQIVYSGNTHGNGSNGLIINDTKGHVPVATVVNNIYTSQGAKAGGKAIWLVNGEQGMIANNNIQGWETGIVVSGNGTLIANNISRCTNGYLISGERNTQQGNL